MNDTDPSGEGPREASLCLPALSVVGPFLLGKDYAFSLGTSWAWLVYQLQNSFDSWVPGSWELIEALLSCVEVQLLPAPALFSSPTIPPVNSFHGNAISTFNCGKPKLTLADRPQEGTYRGLILSEPRLR